MNEIIEARFLAPQVKLFRVYSPDIARMRKAGQFVIIRLRPEGERVPLTIADSSIEDGTITLVVQEVGKSSAMLNSMEKGDKILDVVGPLGVPTHIENFGTAVCVGGGIGLAVVWPIAAALKEAGCRVISIMGARSKDLLILEDEIRAVSDELIITTDDGSYGDKGVVTQPLKGMLEQGREINVCYGIGPVIMMKFVAKTTEPFKVLTYVSLNPIMMDGTGMCGACRVSIGDETKFACVDGPEFDGHKVNFDELIARLATYQGQEKVAYDNFLAGK
ncbi:sulfide/dihydroorotate dehydrogenase-like FAD/NAD-binding protein [candidate division KSB1 bacterium]